MAIAGDVVIKLAADYASFSSGMDDSQKKLVSFGEQAAATAKKIEALAETAKKVAEALAVMWAVDKVLEFGKQLEDTAQSIITQSKALQLSTDAFQAYEAAASKAGLEQATLVTGLERFNAVIGNAVLGGSAAIKTFDDLGVKLLDVNGKVRPTGDLLTEAAQKLLAMKDGATKAALEVQLFGRSGQELNGILQDLAKGQAALVAQNQKLIFPPEVLTQLADFKTRSDEALRSIQVIAAPWWIGIKTDVLEALDRYLKSIAQAMVLINSNAGAFDKIRGAAAALLGQGGNLITDTDNQIRDLGTQLEKVQAQLRDADAAAAKRAQGGLGGLFAPVESQKNIDELKAQAKQLTDQIYALSDARKKMADAANPPSTEQYGPPAPAPGGASQPTSTAQNKAAEDLAKQIQAQVDRYNGLNAASAKAYKTISDGQNQNIEDLKREITVQQQTDDIVAKLKANHIDANAAQRKAIEDAVRGYEQQKDATAHLLEVENEAVATDKKYGDGTVALTKLHKDLNEQLATHRINQTEATAATKEGTEAIEQAALAAQRYQDNLGSLAAGFEHAANAYARSNDLYSQGEQVFNGLTTSMTDGLKALEGQSTKTFSQILLDFANMLAEMAIKAAASQAFKLLFAGAGPSTDLADAAKSAILAPGRASGGPVSPGGTYMVGENGPELFVPSAAGNIVPNGSGGTGVGGVTVNVDMSGGGQGNQPTTLQTVEFARRIKAAVVDQISNEKRPGGVLYTRQSA